MSEEKQSVRENDAAKKFHGLCIYTPNPCRKKTKYLGKREKRYNSLEMTFTV